MLFLKCHRYLTFVRWWIAHFEIESSKCYLMMAFLVKRPVDTRTHRQIWLRREDKVNIGHRFSLNVIQFINNLLQSKLRSYALNFRAFKGSCITSILIARLTLKSPMATIKKGLVTETTSRVISKLLQKFSKSSLDWFGDPHKEAKLQILSPSFIKNVIHSLRQWILISFKGKQFE